MIIDDVGFLKYALRSVHLAEKARGKRSGVAVVANSENTGLPPRLLHELEDTGYVDDPNQQRQYHMTLMGEQTLKALGGPFTNWEDRIHAAKTWD